MTTTQKKQTLHTAPLNAALALDLYLFALQQTAEVSRI